MAGGCRPALAKLLRVHTSKSEDDPIPLADYVAGMQEGQKGIYYIAADSLAAAAASPFVEQLQRRGLEVQYLAGCVSVAAVDLSPSHVLDGRQTKSACCDPCTSCGHAGAGLKRIEHVLTACPGKAAPVNNSRFWLFTRHADRDSESVLPGCEDENQSYPIAVQS